MPTDPDHLHLDPQSIATAIDQAVIGGEDEIFLNVKNFRARGLTDTQVISAADAYRHANGLSQRLYIPGGLGSGTNGEWMMDPAHGNAVALASTSVGLLGDREGTVVKLIDNAGDWSAIFAYTGSDASNFTAEGITFDGNGANNPVTAALPSIQKRIALYIPSGSKLDVNNCYFNNFNGTWTVVLNGTEVIVEGCIFDNIGVNAPNPIDTSTLYVQGSDMFVNNLKFSGGGPNARTPIELHGPNQEVTNVLVENYWAFGNIVGGAAGVKGISWTGLSGTGLGTGVQLWALSGQAPVGSDYGLEDVKVEGDFTIDYDMWAAQFPANHRTGYSLAGSSDLPMRNVKMSGHIRYKTFVGIPSVSDAGSFGVNLSRSNAIVGNDQNIDMSDLEISGAPAGGVIVNLKNTATIGMKLPKKISNIGAGASPNFSSSYRTSVLLTGAFQDLNFDDLLAVDSQVAHTLVSVINSQNVTSAVNCRGYDPVLDVTDGVYVPMVLGSTTPGAALDLRCRHYAYQAPTGLFVAGSSITDVNGVQHVQTGIAAGGGSTWTAVTPGSTTGNNRPSQNGLVAWPADPITATGSAVISNAGVASVVRMTMDATAPITSVTFNISVAAAGLTSAWIEVNDASGAQLGKSVDIAATLNGATGLLTVSLIAPTAAQTLGNDVFASICCTGTTAPTIRGWPAAQMTSIGRTNANSRFCTYGTAQTTPPASLIVANLTNASAQIGLFLK